MAAAVRQAESRGAFAVSLDAEVSAGPAGSVARDRGQVNRLLMGVTVAEGEPIAAGAKLLRGNDEVGQVTSSVFSPRLGQVIALAYLRRGNWEPGRAAQPADVSDFVRVPDSWARSQRLAARPPP